MKTKRFTKTTHLRTFLMLVISFLITAYFSIQEMNTAQAQNLKVISMQGAMLLNEAANLDQCRNGGVGQPPVPCNDSGDGVAGYVNGNAGAQNAHYREGDSIPYRIRFSGLRENSTGNKIVIEYDTTELGKHAIDYLTSYDRTETVAMGNNPCSGVSGCDPSVFHQKTIPVDPRVIAAGVNVVPDAQRAFTCFGCTITEVNGYTYSGDYTGNSKAALTVTFTTNVSNPVMAFGGHIARRQDWGANNSASSIQGSPYHMRLLTLNGVPTGQQDRSLQTDAIIFEAIPTAASVTVAGRVITAAGRGIRNVQVRLVDDMGQVRTVLTGAFGYFRFADVPAGQTYTISVSAKKFTFTQPAQVLNLAGERDDINFFSDN
ncbi:MAG: carboxypeptidase-like regulatory domain-containing protein [Acidobacteriota bacterium]|nr:carboxypeptidase-like regulatory domain-containing protein [Acidobacteriota bacterium]